MGIWIIVYNVLAKNQEQYLKWFHEEHIPEKLARPGYDWAAHYCFEAGHENHTAGYIALFGGHSSRVFYDPSPAQLKPQQDQLTREMIGCREQVQMFIVDQEWSDGLGQGPVDAPFLRLLLSEPGVNDQTLCAWCAQRFFPESIEHNSVKSVRKLLSSTGSVRHTVLQELLAEEFVKLDLQSAGFEFAQDFIARRCWPVE